LPRFTCLFPLHFFRRSPFEYSFLFRVILFLISLFSLFVVFFFFFFSESYRSPSSVRHGTAHTTFPPACEMGALRLFSPLFRHVSLPYVSREMSFHPDGRLFFFSLTTYHFFTIWHPVFAPSPTLTGAELPPRLLPWSSTIGFGVVLRPRFVFYFLRLGNALQLGWRPPPPLLSPPQLLKRFFPMVASLFFHVCVPPRFHFGE